MRVVIGKEQDHIITISLTIATANLESGKVKFWAFADQVLKPLGDSSIGISIDDVLLSKNTTMHQYSDISDQDPQLQKLLNNLVGWSILKDNSLFNGDYPLLWQDYIKLYLKMVYNKNLTDIWSGSMTYGDLVATLPYDPV